MPQPNAHRPGRTRRGAGLLAAVALATAGLTSLPASATAAPASSGPIARYLVQLDEEPLATYTGGVPRIAAVAELEAGIEGRDAPLARAVLRRCRELVPA